MSSQGKSLIRNRLVLFILFDRGGGGGGTPKNLVRGCAAESLILWTCSRGKKNGFATLFQRIRKMLNIYLYTVQDWYRHDQSQSEQRLERSFVTILYRD